MNLPFSHSQPCIRRVSAGMVVVALLILQGAAARAQHTPSADELTILKNRTSSFLERLTAVRSNPRFDNRDGEQLLADVAVFQKAADWMLRHDEFLKPDYAKQLARVLELGEQRLQQAAEQGAGVWTNRPGRSVLGYVSTVDRSVQPYAITLPVDFDSRRTDRYPLHLVLHGRANDMNEVNFIHRHEGKAAAENQTWIQLDVYGRGSNAYRWAGETDVFEALNDVRRRFRIDEARITLHGFSMGGAGAWHLGMHYPHLWSSVGPGAGFVDFYEYQKQSEQRPKWQHQTLGIYDAVDYALNAFNVPVCTYGGELDPQLAASTTMQKAAAEEGVDMRVIVGPQMGHKFDPESQREFMKFHLEKSAEGRPSSFKRKQIRFETRTLRYNRCDWMAIEEISQVYEPSRVDASVGPDDKVDVITFNVSALRISRETAETAIIDGVELPCRSAAEGLLPDVYYVRSTDGWDVLDYDDSISFQANPDRRKRHGLQGPIDDAFQSSFICVRGSGTAWNTQHQKWADWTLQRFEREFDFWMRGRVPVLLDSEVTEETIAQSNLILFGDPGSNSLIARVLEQLPVQWSKDEIRIAGHAWNPSEHGVSLIFPNPLNPSRYVVLNSGHTIHDADFKASNAWLFPRLGDMAVQKFVSDTEGGFTESIEWAVNLGAEWEME
ncbi:MAG: prolyl oligopeptidase family serine peptidase [Planctomycetaceae bacterium]|nr:prolyl oligopeptidase family serine peptidase [Planctomycetaceae bacterium]